MNVAVLSSSYSMYYAFFAPLTCAVWHARRWTPLMMLTGERSLWETAPRSRRVRDACIEAGAVIVYTGFHPGHRDATVSQLQRLYAWAVGMFRPDDYLLTSDIDMWPINSWVGAEREAGKRLQIYYSNAYEGTDRLHFPICYLGAARRTWIEIMQERTLPEALVYARERVPRADEEGILHQVAAQMIPLHVWNFDETYFGECLGKWPGYPGECQLIPRHMTERGQRRLDRSGWQEPANSGVHSVS